MGDSNFTFKVYTQFELSIDTNIQEEHSILHTHC